MCSEPAPPLCTAPSPCVIKPKVSPNLAMRVKDRVLLRENLIRRYATLHIRPLPLSHAPGRSDIVDLGGLRQPTWYFITAKFGKQGSSRSNWASLMRAPSPHCRKNGGAMPWRNSWNTLQIAVQRPHQVLRLPQDQGRGPGGSLCLCCGSHRLQLCAQLQAAAGCTACQHSGGLHWRQACGLHRCCQGLHNRRLCTSTDSGGL